MLRFVCACGAWEGERIMGGTECKIDDDATASSSSRRRVFCRSYRQAGGRVPLLLLLLPKCSAKGHYSREIDWGVIFKANPIES